MWCVCVCRLLLPCCCYMHEPQEYIDRRNLTAGNEDEWEEQKLLADRIKQNKKKKRNETCTRQRHRQRRRRRRGRNKTQSNIYSWVRSICMHTAVLHILCSAHRCADIWSRFTAFTSLRLPHESFTVRFVWSQLKQNCWQNIWLNWPFSWTEATSSNINEK